MDRVHPGQRQQKRQAVPGNAENRWCHAAAPAEECRKHSWSEMLWDPVLTAYIVIVGMIFFFNRRMNHKKVQLSVVVMEHEMLCCFHYTEMQDALQIYVFFCCFPPLIADSLVKLGCVSTECASALWYVFCAGNGRRGCLKYRQMLIANVNATKGVAFTLTNRKVAFTSANDFDPGTAITRSGPGSWVWGGSAGYP